MLVQLHVAHWIIIRSVGLNPLNTRRLFNVYKTSNRCLIDVETTSCVYWETLKLWSSRPEVFCKKGILRNFTKFSGKHLCQSLFFNKIAGLRPATLLKKRPCHRFFLVNFAKFLITSFFIEHMWWLLLEWVSIWFSDVLGDIERDQWHEIG